MSKQVIVIASKCTKDTIYGDRIFELDFPTLEEAISVGNDNRKEGMSVVVRPSYNEVDSQGRNYFREWRSFNGEEFKECRWNF